MRFSWLVVLLLLTSGLPSFAGRTGIATEAHLTEVADSHMRIELGWGGAKVLQEQLQLAADSDLQLRMLPSRHGDLRPYALLDLDRAGTPVRTEISDTEFANSLRVPANPIRLNSVVCEPTAFEPTLLIQLKNDAAEKMYAYLETSGHRSDNASGHPTYSGTHIQCFKKRIARMTRSGPSLYRPLVTLCDIKLTLDGKLLPTR